MSSDWNIQWTIKFQFNLKTPKISSLFPSLMLDLLQVTHKIIPKPKPYNTLFLSAHLHNFWECWLNIIFSYFILFFWIINFFGNWIKNVFLYHSLEFIFLNLIELWHYIQFTCTLFSSLFGSLKIRKFNV